MIDRHYDYAKREALGLTLTLGESMAGIGSELWGRKSGPEAGEG